uniref:Uncharacterized protein n=1 Tax=uncultured marine virus TaxID=186617 RepID=A0A0F7L6R1_9VIRU|nr:hypothetical protein [uncultured marine virus]
MECFLVLDRAAVLIRDAFANDRLRRDRLDRVPFVVHCAPTHRSVARARHGRDARERDVSAVDALAIRNHVLIETHEQRIDIRLWNGQDMLPEHAEDRSQRGLDVPGRQNRRDRCAVARHRREHGVYKIAFGGLRECILQRHERRRAGAHRLIELLDDVDARLELRDELVVCR